MNTSELFSQAVSIEDTEPEKALTIYDQICRAEDHAAAYINAGTICYNHQNYERAERYYRSAVRIDPRYALAYFDLGNVLDETGRVEEAVQTYKTALQLAPTYADVHYNLALAYEKLREPGKALKHWQAYRRLDTTSAWSRHAANQAARILKASDIFLIRENHKPRRTKRRAKLIRVK